ncbi:MAG: sigma-E factor negative regulatory protein [Pseudomonadaceae bacterium]|nr:sigma-E factor negative regulatory protein [Pseudomonadaceae bacterium]
MTEKLHQSLSSIMDGAGDDLELPRLLTAMQASPQIDKELSDKWRRYHLAQGILRSELREVKNPKVAQVDISAAVMQQLEDENLSFTDAGAASELNFSSAARLTPTALTNLASKPALAAEQATKKASNLEKTAPIEKRHERGQWLRGGALAASVALLVITGTQIYNLSQDAGGVTAPHSFAVQEVNFPITTPVIEASLVASDCQSQLFSGGSVINLPIEITQRKPCNSFQAYSPLVNSPQLRQSGITPVSSPE